MAPPDRRPAARSATRARPPAGALKPSEIGKAAQELLEIGETLAARELLDGTLHCVATELYDPNEHAKRLWRENLWLRDILTRVAQDLERLANEAGRSSADCEVLARRALRVRKRLHDGPPEDWTVNRLGGLGTTDDEAEWC
jgi:hypothetical protein